ncbi:contactin-3-like [Pomacea canaliculata]|uniref:contactin-3-like n=1 Tax=Pomacea canaliculata TaxID=400727 RepID=UPI000D73497D|nr:contactin-3-like [Pomacea canaliculata]
MLCCCLSRSLLLTLCMTVFIISSVAGQTIADCPDPWLAYGDYCYQFAGTNLLKFDSASLDCGDDGASLVYITSAEEHNFITNWLEKFDPLHRNWLTSGHGLSRKDTGVAGALPYQWVATSSALLPDLQFWLPGQPNAAMDKSSAAIAYTFGVSGYGWSLVPDGFENAYICKILKVEAYRILQQTRGYDYGLPATDGVIERGPQFISMPNSLVVVSSTGEPAVLECIAFGTPEPTYRWVRGKNFGEEVLASTNSRYSLINGRLIIENPVEAQDSNSYRCEARNKFGTVISSSVAISFGYLGDFSNVQNAPVRAKAYDGVAIECSQIIYRPAIQYQWLKDNAQFVRPEFQSYIFISNNGKLYFSEVTRSDEGRYQCIAELMGVNRFTIGTNQPPARFSLPIPLAVSDQSPKSNWGPEIQNDFPAVFPKPPLRGQDVRLECFAYGSSTTPFYYSWQRLGLPIPASAVFQDYNRVLIIRNAQMEDAGTYNCTVTRTSSAKDTRSFYLALGARPYFVAPLKNQHADVHGHLTWKCEARGNPSPVYRWYKNGQLLTSDPNTRVQVSKNILVITNLDASMHEGMYQCEAVNTYGSEMSNAQLRVLSFAPSFTKKPLPVQMSGAVGGDLVIQCNPEGAPLPQITWLRNGGQLTTGTDGRYIQYPNGDLLIKTLQSSDAGTFTCKAVNDGGEAESSTTIFVASGAAIATGPSAVSAIVNETAFLQCTASRDPTTDVNFVWYFNNYPLDISDPTFSVVSETQASSRTGLYIKGVQFKYEGQYTCVLQTPFTADSKSGYLTVRGPPSMPAGLYVRTESVTQTSVMLMWTVGADNGGAVVSFIVEAEDEFNPNEWQTVLTVATKDSIPADILQTDKHGVQVDNLNPGNGYRFRVSAQNEFGIGTPSIPSDFVKTLDAPPSVAPSNVRGGGGSVGDLTIRWDLLDRSEWGSSSVYYRVYWRKKTEGDNEGRWQSATKTGTDDHHVTLVGIENFFLLYEVKVQAINPLGQGPNSSIEEVYSAEDLPLGVPTNVVSNTYNTSTIEVSWTPVPDTREAARGKILGYQINYWPQDLDNRRKDEWQFIRYYGDDVSSGLVINLATQVNTWVGVQVVNSAGLGPLSEQYLMETAFYPSWHYPEEVRVSSVGAGQVRIWWRGILTTTWEAGLTAYVIFYWNANEDFRTRQELQVKFPINEAILDGLEENTLYAIRVCGYNAGGYGAKSPTQYFTFEGSVFINSGLSQAIDTYLAQATCPRPTSIILILLAFHTFFSWIGS